MVLIVNLSRVVFAPLLEPLRAALGADTAALGLLATLVWAGSALSRLPTGWLLTRIPRHVAILVTGGLLTGATVLAATAPDFRALGIAALLMGLTTGVYFIAANPLISELFPARIGSALGVYGAAAQVAAVGAPLLITRVLGVGTWRTVFWLVAAAALASTVAFTVAAWLTDLPQAGTEDRDLLGAVRTQWRIVLTGVVMMGATMFLWQGLFNFYVTYFVGQGLAEDTGRVLLSVTFAAGIPAFLLSGRLADLLPDVPYILVLLATFPALVIALTAASGVVVLGVLSALVGYVAHSFIPALDTYLLGSLPDRHRASAYSAYSASMMSIQAGGSWVVGTLEASYQFTTIFRTFALGLLLIAGMLSVAHSRGRLPTAARA